MKIRSAFGRIKGPVDLLKGQNARWAGSHGEGQRNCLGLCFLSRSAIEWVQRLFPAGMGTPAGETVIKTKGGGLMGVDNFFELRNSKP
ncbi:hypothetical protein MESS4_310097 [Mesorhizobium sp. STM 4661]|nr:hypothetical protein MESS4_310097 [Mesorhizobium sp. STM 4661]